MKIPERCLATFSENFFMSLSFLPAWKKEEVLLEIENKFDEKVSDIEVINFGQGLLNRELALVIKKEDGRKISMINKLIGQFHGVEGAEELRAVSVYAHEIAAEAESDSAVAKRARAERELLNADALGLKNAINGLKDYLINVVIKDTLDSCKSGDEVFVSFDTRIFLRALISDALELTKCVSLAVGDGNELFILEEKGHYFDIGEVEHCTVGYAEPSPEYGDNAMTTNGTEYFSLFRKENAIDAFVERYLFGSPHKAAGVGSQSLEDIKVDMSIARAEQDERAKQKTSKGKKQ